MPESALLRVPVSFAAPAANRASSPSFNMITRVYPHFNRQLRHPKYNRIETNGDGVKPNGVFKRALSGCPPPPNRNALKPTGTGQSGGPIFDGVWARKCSTAGISCPPLNIFAPSPFVSESYANPTNSPLGVFVRPSPKEKHRAQRHSERDNVGSEGVTLMLFVIPSLKECSARSKTLAQTLIC